MGKIYKIGQPEILMEKELSVILPCLNEEASIGECINVIKEVLVKNKINGEIIAVDNASNDSSPEIIKKSKVIYVYEEKKGYGNAYIAGIKKAKGKFLILGDPDGSYDFNEIPNFLKELKKNDMIIGSRYLGNITKGSMPLSHRYLGNPLIRILLRINGIKLKETCTGFVGIKKESLEKLQLKQPGMEFSSEFLVNAKKNNLSMKEIPITYHPRMGESKLDEIRDGIRHFNFLISSRIVQR